MLPGFARDTVTVQRATVVEERGTTRLDWSNPAETVVAGCSVQPMAGDEKFTAGSQEGGGRRDAVITRWKLYAPPGIDLLARDRVVHAGVAYQIDGSPQRWPSPSGALSHVTALLFEVEG